MQTAWRNFPLYHLPQFLIGNCLVHIYLNHVKLKFKFALSGFLIFGILSGLRFTNILFKHEIFSGNTYVVISFSGLILFSAFIDKYINKSIPGLLVLFGEASYSLYILQSPLKLFFQQIWSKVFKISFVDGFFYAIYLSVGAILVSIVSYKFFEIPGRKKIISIFLSTSDK
jgi:peptidoglycan/LPS O-acetylase OafA/YrhL